MISVLLPLVGSCAALWAMRWTRRDPTLLTDLAITLTTEYYFNLSTSRWTTGHLLLHASTRFAAWWLVRLSTTVRSADGMSSNLEPSRESKECWTRPVILPCRTTHSRMFPRKHSFSYSYLLVGIPVGWSGCTGSLLSADTSANRGWFHVDAADYLARGDGHLGLRGKLDAYLETQEISSVDFPYAYLTTAPRICGYSFNPVSFWYLYSAHKELKAMILEVNNTFDERRMYFLKAEEGGRDTRRDEDEEDGVQDVSVKDARVVFSNEWKKDFHVSPFNSREGSYRLVAHDPAPFSEQSLSIGNTITLLSSEGHKKLVARVSSAGRAIDPSNMTLSSTVSLIVKWGWVGFFTFPRIVREAWKLYFKKTLEVFFRPEVAKGSIARHATDAEKILEPFFFAYLQHIVKMTAIPITLTYRPAPGTGTHSKAILKSASAEEAVDAKCDFEVTSPVFYSRFVHYAHTSEAIDREYLCTDAKNRTISISNVELLVKLFESKQHTTPAQSADTRLQKLGSIDQLRWQLLQRLRCAAAEQSYPRIGQKELVYERQDIRSLPLSQLDVFIIQNGRDAWIYRRQLTLLFLAQRTAYGFSAVIDLGEVALKCAVMYFVWSISGGNLHTVLHGSSHILRSFTDILFRVAIASTILNSYSFAKGFQF